MASIDGEGTKMKEKREKVGIQAMMCGIEWKRGRIRADDGWIKKVRGEENHRSRGPR